MIGSAPSVLPAAPVAVPALAFGGVALDTATLLALVLVAFLAGIGITAIGPGGVFVTIALSLVLARPGLIAGTAGATNIATGIVGSAVYAHSGELRTEQGKRMMVVLSLTGLAGALLGAGINAFVSAGLFEVLLGGFVALAGVLTWYRERYGSGGGEFDARTRRGTVLVAGVGFAVGVPAGLLGVGGPVLAVPLLVALGAPMVPAVAVAQVQSIFIAGFATAGYLFRDAVSLWLVALIGVPELIGVVVGWQVAHRVSARRLKLALAVVLVTLGPYIALG
jgi:uncharacterized membrane protein YfcA